MVFVVVSDRIRQQQQQELCLYLINVNIQMWVSTFPMLCASPCCEVKGERDGKSVLGSLLKCPDRSDASICLTNEMVTYGGYLNSFDKAGFFMQSSGLEAGVFAWTLLPAGRTRTRVSTHVVASFWINSANLFKHSWMWFILSLWGHADRPTVAQSSRGCSPLPPQAPKHTPCAHTSSATVFPSMRQLAKSRIQSI